MSRHLILVGGGHLHLPVLSHVRKIVQRGHRVSLVSPDPEHVYSGMGPGVIGGFYRPEEAMLPVRALVESAGGRFIRDRVVRVAPRERRLFLASGEELTYDVVSFNVGSEVVSEGLSLASDAPLVPVKPLSALLELSEQLPARFAAAGARVTIVGGGAAGVELAGNLAARLKRTGLEARLQLIAGGGLLAGFPPTAAMRARRALYHAGVNVLEGVRVSRVERETMTLADGQIRRCGLTLLATGIRPSRLFLESGLPVGSEGGLEVDACLRSPQHPEIFGGGDGVDFQGKPLPRVGVYAVRQGPVLAHNLFAALEDRPLAAFHPQSNYLLILNLGDGRGLALRPPLCGEGFWAFWLKDRIDRAFVRRCRAGG